MKFTEQYIGRISKKLIAFIAIAFMITMLAGVASASHGPGSIAYQGEDTEGPDHAAFNIYSGDVPANPSNEGEQDFVTVSQYGEQNWSNQIEVCDGKADMHVYVHNGAEVESNHTNGNDYKGDGVAHGTRLQVTIPDEKGKKQTVSAKISADNTLTVEDDAQIVCNEYPIELTYIPGSGQVYRAYTQEIETADDNIVSKDGAPIGHKTDDGVVPGCWEYRLYYVFTVKVEKAEKPEQPEEPEEPVEREVIREVPVELPVTGPASLLGLFTATSVAGAAAHRLYTSRRG